MCPTKTVYFIHALELAGGLGVFTRPQAWAECVNEGLYLDPALDEREKSPTTQFQGCSR